MADTYLNYNGKLVKLVDNGDGTVSIAASVLAPVPVGLMFGIATSGTTTTLTDDSKGLEQDSLIGKLIKFTIEGVEYIRKITTNDSNEISFLDTVPDTGAIATVGSGLEAQGQVKIAVAEGTGAGYSVRFAKGAGVSSAAIANYNTSTGALTLISPTNDSENPVGILPENLQGIINANADANGLFTVTVVMNEVLPTETDVLSFTNDEMTVGRGKIAEGMASVHCKGDLIGTTGDEYSIQIAQGTAKTGDNVATLDAENKLLLITVNLTGTGEARNLGAGDLQTLLANTVDIADKFVVPDGFTEGSLPIGGDAIPFIGGIDGIPVTAGTTYTIFD